MEANAANDVPQLAQRNCVRANIPIVGNRYVGGLSRELSKGALSPNPALYHQPKQALIRARKMRFGGGRKSCGAW